MKSRSRFRNFIQKYRLYIEGLLGQFFFRHSALASMIEKNPDAIRIETLHNFRYSQLSHFKNFSLLPRYREQSIKTCDLKVYQDLFIYTFIKDNFPPGAKFLEIGGGQSRIIEMLNDQYEFWNLDKLEGSGFGPKGLWTNEGFNLVRDYIGNFSNELPDDYFDLVFSISTLEHLPTDETMVDAALDDIQRVLKPGGISLHCVDGLLHQNSYFIHPSVTAAHNRGWIPFSKVAFEELQNDADIWLLPKFAFYTRWYPLVRQPLNSFGRAFSINVYWQK